MSSDIAIHWFRQDLRVGDNPGLLRASQHGAVMPIYILDDGAAGEYAMGAASRWWLHHSLGSLNGSLDGALSLYVGNPLEIISGLLERYSVGAVYWNRCYEPWRMERDGCIKAELEKRGVVVEDFNGSLLWEPWTIKKADGNPYKVFTPFYRKGCLAATSPREPLARPSNSPQWLHDEQQGVALDDIKLLPKINWDKKFEAYWHIGEKAAHKRLENFIERGLRNYNGGRNLPAKPYVSRLSPHLHFGEISPHYIYHKVRASIDDKYCEQFYRQLGWREFSYSLLHYNPELPRQNLYAKFDSFPWREDDSLLAAWQAGQTGIPMVDAGMRELWQSGYMHNRVRMITASFLVKNLRLHWHYGERWFWDTLVDADLANNSASWQWVAGCGADAAPYFRIFNPIIQGKKFDSDGDYVRRFVPELAAMPTKYLFNPWQAPAKVLAEAKVELGKNYPAPIVDLPTSRNEALTAYKSLSRPKLS